MSFYCFRNHVHTVAMGLLVFLCMLHPRTTHAQTLHLEKSEYYPKDQQQGFVAFPKTDYNLRVLFIDYTFKEKNERTSMFRKFDHWVHLNISRRNHELPELQTHASYYDKKYICVYADLKIKQVTTDTFPKYEISLDAYYMEENLFLKDIKPEIHINDDEKHTPPKGNLLHVIGTKTYEPPYTCYVQNEHYHTNYPLECTDWMSLF